MASPLIQGGVLMDTWVALIAVLPIRGGPIRVKKWDQAGGFGVASVGVA